MGARRARSLRMQLGSGVSVMLAAIVVAAVLAAPAGAAFPGLNGLIAFERGFTPDIYTMNPDGSVQSMIRPSAEDPVWSRDGSKIAFIDLTNSSSIRTMNPDGTSPTLVCDCIENNYGTGSVGSYLTWSPDGTSLAFEDGPSPSTRQIYRVNVDGTGETQLTSVGANRGPAWSPDGTKIAFTSDRFPAGVWVMNADGTGQTGLSLGTSGATGRPSWSPDGTKIAFGRGRIIEVINADGSGQMPLTTNTNGFDDDPAWSPDGQFIAYENGIDFDDHLTVMNADGTNHTPITNNLDQRPDWQPAPPTYARPKGATPLYVSLVPGYAACASPNREHGPPLAFSSCSPPVQSSNHLTVGSPDANGQPAKSTGFVRAAVIAGNPQTQTDEADVRLQLQITDVRRSGDLDDYTGEVQVRANLRLTDKLNSPGVSAPGTVVDMPYTFTAGCAATPDTTVGSTCQVTTSADAIAFGTAPESRRSIWQLGQIEVYDGGPDGVASTSGNTLFETGGLFIP